MVGELGLEDAARGVFFWFRGEREDLRTASTTTTKNERLKKETLLPVKVLGPTQRDEAVGRGQLAEHADVVAVLELAAGRLGAFGVWMLFKTIEQNDAIDVYVFCLRNPEQALYYDRFI